MPLPAWAKSGPRPQEPAPGPRPVRPEEAWSGLELVIAQGQAWEVVIWDAIDGAEKPAWRIAEEVGQSVVEVEKALFRLRGRGWAEYREAGRPPVRVWTARPVRKGDTW